MRTAALSEIGRNVTQVFTDAERWRETQARCRALAAEAATRRVAGHPVDADWLSTATAWVAAVAPDWETLTGCVPATRDWRLLVDEPDLQGWLIAWPAGTGLGFHDHGGAPGAFRVVRGTLEERLATLPGLAPEPHWLVDGTVGTLGPLAVHSVSNPCSTLATSVHLYGRALRAQIDFEVAAAGFLRPCQGVAAA